MLNDESGILTQSLTYVLHNKKDTYQNKKALPEGRARYILKTTLIKIWGGALKGAPQVLATQLLLGFLQFELFVGFSHLFTNLLAGYKACSHIRQHVASRVWGIRKHD